MRGWSGRRGDDAALLFTALWHFVAFWHFTFYPERTLARTTRERPVHTVSAELFRFLGGINAALVVLALASLALSIPPARWPALLALAVANLSQLVVDLRVKRLGLAHGHSSRRSSPATRSSRGPTRWPAR